MAATAETRFDVIVLGTGQAGVPLATRFAAAGRRVLVAERGEPGGTCVNFGCTPTKTMIASAKVAHTARTAARFGVHTASVSVDLGEIVDRKDAIVRSWQDSVVRRLEGAAPNLTFLRGHARFAGERLVEVNGRRYAAATIVVNVGARPIAPPIPGLAEVPWLDNHRVMQVRSLPEHLIILGGGYVGCEFAQMFRRFGARVTIADHGAHVLSREDPDVSSALEGVLREEGIALELPAEIDKVGKSGSGIFVRLASGKELRGSHLLVAVGRRPNTDDLGCDAAGIQLDPEGAIVADDRYRTSAEGVYAVGDVLGGPQFTHASWDDHRLLFDLLQGRSQRGRSSRIVPYTVFTDPQVAAVGLNEREARRRGLDVEVATMPFAEIARAIEMGQTAGILKVILDRRTERILGASIVGAEAGELIHIFVALMKADASPRAFVEAEAVHPTYAEGVQSVLMKLPRFALS